MSRDYWSGYSSGKFYGQMLTQQRNDYGVGAASQPGSISSAAYIAIIIFTTLTYAYNQNIQTVSITLFSVIAICLATKFSIRKPAGTLLAALMLALTFFFIPFLSARHMIQGGNILYMFVLFFIYVVNMFFWSYKTR